MAYTLVFKDGKVSITGRRRKKFVTIIRNRDGLEVGLQRVDGPLYRGHPAQDEPGRFNAGVFTALSFAANCF